MRDEPKIAHVEIFEEPYRCRIKPDWEGAGIEGWYFGKMKIGRQWAVGWGIVQWDRDSNPSLFNLAGMQFAQWEDAR